MCLKRGFKSEKEARTEINKIKRYSWKSTIPRRCYKCPVCGKRHLTSEYLVSKKR